jgi:hypothetical protein
MNPGASSCDRCRTLIGDGTGFREGERICRACLRTREEGHGTDCVIAQMFDLWRGPLLPDLSLEEWKP